MVVLTSESLTCKASNWVVMDHHCNKLDYTSSFTIVRLEKRGRKWAFWKPHYLAQLRSVGIIKGFGEGGKMYRQSNSHQHMEYLVRMAPQIESPGLPRLWYPSLFPN